MTNKTPRWTAASPAAVAVAAMVWMTMPVAAQQPNMVTAGTVAPDLRAFPDDNARFVAIVKQGKNSRMPPWADILSDQEITEIWAFVSSRRKP